MGLERQTRGGQGGKKGHSNMTHWTGTEEIKRANKKHLRQDAKRESTQEIDDKAAEERYTRENWRYG